MLRTAWYRSFSLIQKTSFSGSHQLLFIQSQSTNVFTELVQLKRYLFTPIATLTLLMKFCKNLPLYRTFYIKNVTVLNTKMMKAGFALSVAVPFANCYFLSKKENSLRTAPEPKSRGGRMRLTLQGAAKARCLPRRSSDSSSLLTGAELRPLPSPLALPRHPAHGPAPRGVASAAPPRRDLSTAKGRGATFFHPHRLRPVPS